MGHQVPGTRDPVGHRTHRHAQRAGQLLPRRVTDPHAQLRNAERDLLGPRAVDQGTRRTGRRPRPTSLPRRSHHHHARARPPRVPARPEAMGMGWVGPDLVGMRVDAPLQPPDTGQRLSQLGTRRQPEQAPHVVAHRHVPPLGLGPPRPLIHPPRPDKRLEARLPHRRGTWIQRRVTRPRGITTAPHRHDAAVRQNPRIELVFESYHTQRTPHPKTDDCGRPTQRRPRSRDRPPRGGSRPAGVVESDRRGG